MKRHRVRFRVFALLALHGLLLACASGIAVADQEGTRPADGLVLRRLGADEGQLRFTGETESRTFAVYALAAEADSPARLHVSYNNAAAVMAEASTMQIEINGVAVSTTAIAAPSGSDTQGFDVDLPRGLIEPGFNAVAIAIQQRHGVDCSIAATYELWTQIDPAATGIVFASPPAINSLADLPGVPPDPDGSTPLRLVVPPGSAPARIDQLLQAAQIVALRGHFGHTVVSTEAAPSGKPGLDLVLGTAAELRNADLVPASGPPAPFSLRAGIVPGNVLLVIAGDTGAELDTNLRHLLTDRADAPLTGTDAGLRALARAGGVDVSGGSDITLRAAGVASQEFSGRLFRVNFDLRMPADFYPADYDKLTLLIDGAYAGDLDRRNQILVRVNDRDAASLPLSDPGGLVLRGRPITVPLSNLRPGRNRIMIEALLAAPSDDTCDARTTIAARRRFVLLDSTRVRVPALARIAHLPSLSATAANAFPYAARGYSIPVYLPHPDGDAIGAAGTLLAKLAVAAGQPVGTRLLVSNPPDPGASALMLGTLADFPGTVLDAMNLDGSAIQDGWARAGAQAAESLEPTQPATADEGSRNDALLRSWSRSVTGGHWQSDLRRLVGGTLNRLVGLSQVRSQLFGEPQSPYAPNRATRLVVAQREAPAGAGATWTLVTAPARDVLADGMRTITDPSHWRQLDGGLTALDGPGDPLRTRAPSSDYFISTVPWRPDNMRLIAAGWLSDHLNVYVAIFLAFCVLVAGLTAAMLKRTGVRP